MDSCLPDLQSIIRNNGLGKIKMVTANMQNVLVNINSFLSMKQRGDKSIRLYLGRLKGTAKHCNFNLPTGKTCYMDKMVLHTLVQ